MPDEVQDQSNTRAVPAGNAPPLAAMVANQRSDGGSVPQVQDENRCPECGKPKATNETAFCWKEFLEWYDKGCKPLYSTEDQHG